MFNNADCYSKFIVSTHAVLKEGHICHVSLSCSEEYVAVVTSRKQLLVFSLGKVNESQP